LQSSFLRGKLDIARILLSRGADIGHVDSDGYSVLSYLWVVDEKLEKSVDFERLCLANDFSEVNACDNRGWTAFHRAAAVGTAEDVEAFLRLGASLDLRAEWYGWTALFFAASHDNIETFQTIVQHSGADVYESLDGDGWSLLHCCIYFGAPRVMKLVLQNGVDVNQLTLPAPLPEDPPLSYRELTASDIAFYIGPNRYEMFMNVLIETGRDTDLENDDVFWDAAESKAEPDDKLYERSGGLGTSDSIVSAEDVGERWTLLHWASYAGSPKIKNLFLLKGVNSEHLEAIELETYPYAIANESF
jgi:ankyrin repeat protein